ncbi:MAG: carboxypeptidase-like regulatory domain-containing protein [Bacteroidota bacterium]|nr:carboxypeptidase-like regulatory domain-containing protein [Bacteroidota bacterium]
MKKYFLITFVLVFCFNKNKSQTSAPTKSVNLIQFSGQVLDQDSLTVIPFVSILIKGTNRGTHSDFNGFFSLVVTEGDELEFKSLIHKTRVYKIADTLKQKYYFAVQVLTKDTVELPTVEVFPWPSKEEFKRAFLALNLNDTDIDRAEKNLKRETLTYLERNQVASASENYKYMMLALYTKAYTAGQAPTMSILSPIAWAQFIDAIKKGKYKKKK